MLRPLSTWSVRHVALVWLCGIALQVTLLLVLGDPPPPRQPPMTMLPDSTIHAPPLSPAQRDSLLAELREHGVDVRLDSAGALAGVTLTDTATRRVAGAALTGAMRGLRRMIAEILLLLFGIPALLLGFTFVWARARRRARRETAAPAG